MQQSQNPAPSGIWAKLLEIQKSHKTFAPSEDSEKKGQDGRSAYRFTPTWKITESIREKMDALGLMLIPEFTFRQIDTIEYPVYKMIGDSPMTFMKKELHVAIDASFTWVDAATGEKAGPFHIACSGANGTDKSTATAQTYAERYFLLKFFHITTREPSEEPDMQDCDTIQGLPKDLRNPIAQAPRQPHLSGPYAAQPAPAIQQPYQPQAFGPSTPAGYGAQPQPMTPPVQQSGQQVNVFTVPPQYMQGSAPQGVNPGFDENNPYIRETIDRLAFFEKGTASHGQAVQESVQKLSSMGFNCTVPGFVDNLVEGGQARRENRSPRYAA